MELDAGGEREIGGGVEEVFGNASATSVSAPEVTPLEDVDDDVDNFVKSVAATPECAADG